MKEDLRGFLAGLFRTAIGAAHPSSFLPNLLPAPPKGRLIILAAGKAAGSMTEVAESHYLDRLKVAPDRLQGIAVARHGYGRPTRKVEMVEAGHPIPDAAGLEAAAQSAGAGRKRRRRRSRSRPDVGRRLGQLDRAGGRACRFADKQAVTRALLRSGANIGEINTVRKHLSRIKGGRLARARAAGARRDAGDL